MIAAVAGVTQPIREHRSPDDRLVVADLLECEGWVCESDPDYAVARVVDARGLKLADACADCLPVVAGWWWRSAAGVSVLWPVDSTVFVDITEQVA